jgi:peroxiredoxin
MNCLRLGTSLVLLMAAAHVVFAAPPKAATLTIGQPAPDFCLPGVDGQEHSLGDFSAARVLVIVFTCNHCPTAQAYEGRLRELVNDYRGRGVAVVAISPNDALAVRLDELGYTDVGDSLEDMKRRAEEQDFNFPYLYDGENQKVSLAYGPIATPHVFVFDAQRKLRYTGRIDDSAKPARVTSRDTRNAIDALLAGREVAVKTTRTFGCSVKWSDKRASARESLERWNQETAELTPIDQAGVRKLVKNDTDKLRLINVWATWCGPCRAEFPELVKMHRMYRKRDFELVTISADVTEQHQAALKFLNEQHASCTNFRFEGGTEYALAEALDAEWRGPLPYTLLVAPGGKVLYRQQDKIEPLSLRRAIVNDLGRVYK